MKSLIISCVFLIAAAAQANELSDATAFRSLFFSQVREVQPKASDGLIDTLQFLPDASVQRALQAPTLEEALASVAQTTLPQLVENDAQVAPLAPATVPDLQRPLTMVLVPGVFAEFIPTHAFEEVFEKQDDPFRAQFADLVKKNQAKDSVLLVNNYAPKQAPETARDLDQLFLVNEIQVQGKTVRVILFNTEFSTLESLGQNAEVARRFNARLQKYLDLTGPQDLAFVGYSRGTPLGLEMLAQAKAAGAPWVKDVKAMISLSGVVWGSSLADESYYDTQSPMNQILNDLKNTADSLQFVDASKDVIVDPQNRAIALANVQRWWKFAKNAMTNFKAMNADKSGWAVVSTLNSLVSTDPRTPLNIAWRMWQQLGLNNPEAQYNENIVRFRYFITQLMTSVQELTTRSRIQWWTTHDLPLNPTYYAITASMANPDADAVQKKLYANPLAYGGLLSYDDVSLLQNTLDYTKITKAQLQSNGVTLNDSQVSVAQAAFLPKVIAALRPSNAGIKTKFLGIAGTHHWGMALRVVNKNFLSPNGGRNGFPREAMLKALAAQVMIDQANQQ